MSTLAQCSYGRVLKYKTWGFMVRIFDQENWYWCLCPRFVCERQEGIARPGTYSPGALLPAHGFLIGATDHECRHFNKIMYTFITKDCLY